MPVPPALAPRLAAATGFASVVAGTPALAPAAAVFDLLVVALLPTVAVRPLTSAVFICALEGSAPQLTGMIKSALAIVDPEAGLSLQASLTATNLGSLSVNQMLSPAAAA